jgi:hypothetical protein
MLSAKNLPVKGLCGRCLYVLNNRLEIQSVVFVFSGPALRNLTLLTFSLVSFPPPLPCVNMFTVYTCTVCGGLWGHGRGGGLRQINTCLKVPLQLNLFR